MKWLTGHLLGYLLVCLLLLTGRALAYNDIFAAPVNYAVGESPRDLVAADFDRDGDFDLAVVNFGKVMGVNDSVTILLNDGNGIFQIDTNLITGDGPRAICAATFYDVEWDSKTGDSRDVAETKYSYPDLAVVNYLTTTVSVFLNEYGQSFSNSSMFWAGETPTAICAARLRGSACDLIIGNLVSMEIWIMFNNGWGVFSLSDKKVLSNDVRGIRSADLDGDRDLDLVVVTGDLEILINSGLGRFGTPVVYDSGPGIFTDACVADFDGDGDVDIAGAVHYNKIVVWPNQGDGTMGAPAIFAAGACPEKIAASDLDRDGDVDLVLSGVHEAVIIFSANDGSGNFRTEGIYPAGSSIPRSLAVADVDDDNDDDVISANYGTDNISVFFNKIHTARCALEPDYVDAIEAYGSEPMTGVVHLGDFDNGYSAGDIDPFTVSINGVAPSTVTIVNDFPGIAGDVVRMEFDLAAFGRNYGAVWGNGLRYFRISGQFTDEAPFAAGDNIYICGFIPGDANANRRVDIGDAVFLMNYLYREGTAPILDAIADINCDGGVDIGDVVYLINYIFKGGDPPGQP